LHLVGHSYGAALALETTRRLGNRVKSLTLVEPVSFHLLRQERRPEWGEIEQLGKAVLGGVANGDDRAAAAAFMSYWLGRWRWRLSPERFKSAIVATIPKVALEFGIIVEAPTTLKDYASVTVPTLLIKGSKTRAPTRACGRSPRRSFAECEGRDAKGRGPYEPVHPSRRAQPVDTRSPRRSAVTFTPSPSPSSSTSRANSSSSSFA
jgi:pimeloyl-ACP methyl ester carboxylesterase